MSINLCDENFVRSCSRNHSLCESVISFSLNLLLDFRPFWVLDNFCFCSSMFDYLELPKIDSLLKFFCNLFLVIIYGFKKTERVNIRCMLNARGVNLNNVSTRVTPTTTRVHICKTFLLCQEILN